MTDNEKRAHDFATATLPILYTEKVKEVARNADTGSAAGVDLFALYMNCYEAALEAFNQRFPEE
ncbi:MAG: hypothetical protein LUC47_07750 [Clostridiales bacterium]|nr:hypothetical protein [Clostridiales bacterium]